MESGGTSDPLLESFRSSAERAGIAFSEEEFTRLKPQYDQMLDGVRRLREVGLSLGLLDVEPAIAFLPQATPAQEG